MVLPSSGVPSSIWKSGSDDVTMGEPISKSDGLTGFGITDSFKLLRYLLRE